MEKTKAIIQVIKPFIIPLCKHHQGQCGSFNDFWEATGYSKISSLPAKVHLLALLQSHRAKAFSAKEAADSRIRFFFHPELLCPRLLQLNYYSEAVTQAWSITPLLISGIDTGCYPQLASSKCGIELCGHRTFGSAQLREKELPAILSDTYHWLGTIKVAHRDQVGVVDLCHGMPPGGSGHVSALPELSRLAVKDLSGCQALSIEATWNGRQG